MRCWALLLLLLIGACAGPRATRPGNDSAAIRQCLADLDRAGIGYRSLPDRSFDGGCANRGTIDLRDIGTPVTNLGPMTCPLARSFADWVRDAVQPAAKAWLDQPVVRIESFGTYSCRPVNNRAGARLSEHAFANAVDVAAFVLQNGRRITVKDGWKGQDAAVRDFLRAVHGAGCRRFAVTIGPDGDAEHYNHFHLDLGRGPYCR